MNIPRAKDFLNVESIRFKGGIRQGIVAEEGHSSLHIAEEGHSRLSYGLLKVRSIQFGQ